jgi:hypothetical protein
MTFHLSQGPGAIAQQFLGFHGFVSVMCELLPFPSAQTIECWAVDNPIIDIWP